MGYTVYMHTSPSGKRYIGITGKKPHLRWDNGNGYKPNQHFYNAILKYGWDNIKHEILFTDLSKEEAEQKEIELIALYKSNQHSCGYNRSSGGGSRAIGCHWTLNDEVKNKLSLIHKGKATWNKGKKLSEEHKAKIKLSAPRSKVVCIETSKVYKSINEAQEETKIKYQAISRVCRGERKTAGGYHWRYCNEE